MLHQLEEEHLIEVIATGTRAKSTFAVTKSGRETLRTVKERGRENHRKMHLYRNLILDIFGGTRVTARKLLFDIKSALDELPPGSESNAVQVLEECLDKLKGME